VILAVAGAGHRRPRRAEIHHGELGLARAPARGGAVEGGRDLGDLVRAGAGGTALDRLGDIAIQPRAVERGDAGPVAQQQER
jgi:hypothetical protein